MLVKMIYDSLKYLSLCILLKRLCKKISDFYQNFTKSGPAHLISLHCLDFSSEAKKVHYNILRQ